jgi:hypothetical protein
MTTATIDGMTVITLEKDYPDMDTLLTELGIDDFFIANPVRVSKTAGISGYFIARDCSEDREPINEHIPGYRAKVKRWIWHWMGPATNKEVENPRKGDKLVLDASLELAREVACS